MNAVGCTAYESPEVLDFQKMEKPAARDNEIAEAFTALERGVQTALETYSNVHRQMDDFARAAAQRVYTQLE